jgi:signal transduction histidine kinase
MTVPLLILQVAIEAAFGLLAAASAVSWIRHRDRRHAFQTLALGSLAVLILIAPEMGGSGAQGQALTDLALGLFLLSGYGLLMFRDSFIALRPTTRRIAVIGIVAVGAFGLVAQMPAQPQVADAPVQTLALVAILAVWGLCLLEPAVRFWLVSSGRPSVEAARLRALSLGYAGILALVLVGTLGGSLGDQALTLVTDAIALSIVPILYFTLSPPQWMRRYWREPEEQQFRLALHDLLLYSPDRATLAMRALGWAARLVGGEAAFIRDSDGSILASRGMPTEEASSVAVTAPIPAVAAGIATAVRLRNMVIVPLDLHEGPGAMIVLSGRLTPLFGDDELGRLSQYASSIVAGLDRVLLNSRIAALERAKTEFLNIASHELRGPMTVIKGYLTMLEAGSLGEMSTKAQSVLPLLISKSDEVNWMIEQMIEASRLEEGRLALKKQHGDIVHLTDLAIAGVRMLLADHELEVDEPASPIDAVVDPDRFQIVIRNLLSNAAKYSPAGTAITVRVRRAGDNATVAVIDQGVGISPADQGHLFTRFGRIETMEHVAGTGLGLWLSREIARMHDGDLTLESAVGVGSTFLLRLPLNL